MKRNIVGFSLKLKSFIKKTWGFSPSIAKWAYDSIIIPRISYASSIWIHAINEKVNAAIIDSTQNLAVRAATCVIRGTPNRSIKMAMGIIPIREHVKIIATLETCRMMNMRGWKNNDNCAAKRWKERYLRLSNWSSKLDSTISTKKGVFNTIYPTRQEWRSDALNNTDSADIHIYTDASVDRINSRTGVGIFCNELNIHFAGKSERIMSSCKAETIAIGMAIGMMNERKISNCKILIITDSMSAMKVLENPNYNSKIVNGIQAGIRRLNSANVTISFMWIPSHTTQENIHITGNRFADDLSRSEYAKHCPALHFAHMCKKEIKSLMMKTARSNKTKFPENTHQTSKMFAMDKRMIMGEDLNNFL